MKPAQKTDFPAKMPPVKAYSLVRKDGLWQMLEMAIPVEDLELYITKKSDPDLLSMLVARVENELHRLPENG